jgi:hypothetical protein
MDFELNKRECTPNQTPTPDADCAPNGLTPLRSNGDKLITYDLSRGGTVATISIRTWNGSAWGGPTVISGGSNPQALGSINTSTINAVDSGGASNGLKTALGKLDPRTFGEASISFSALFGTSTCGSFGSAYLKSRSSDSFTAALKDFVPPTPVSIANCAALTTNASNTPNTTDTPATIGDSISDVAILSGATDDATGTITFTLYSDDQCTNEVDTNLTPVTVDGNGDLNSGNYTPNAPGTYYWIASYSGDDKKEADSGECGDANESSVVGKAAAYITTAQKLFPQDSATLSATAGGTPTGTVDFALYAPSDTNCSGTPIFTQQNVNLTNGVANTNNTNFSVNQASSGNYKWVVHYDGDATHNEATSACGKEAFTATIEDDTTN